MSTTPQPGTTKPHPRVQPQAPPPPRAEEDPSHDPFHQEQGREESLLRAHQSGDPAALEALLLLMQPRLMSICFRMSRDPENASDLCQEAMVRIIRGLPGFSGRSRLSTWMIRVTMNVCLTERRRGILRKAVSLDQPAPHTGEYRVETAREPSPDSRVERGEELRALSEALARLDPEPRAMIILRDAQGLDYADIAEILGVPVGTVKSRLFRARVALREQIEGKAGGVS